MLTPYISQTVRDRPTTQMFSIALVECTSRPNFMSLCEIVFEISGFIAKVRVAYIRLDVKRIKRSRQAKTLSHLVCAESVGRKRVKCPFATARSLRLRLEQGRTIYLCRFSFASISSPAVRCELSTPSWLDAPRRQYLFFPVWGSWLKRMLK
jgi:hypothetical protein